MAIADKSNNMDTKANVIVDGILRYPRTGLDIIIIGAGLGGMMAAIECWRKGHEVQIIEKESGLLATGDIVAIGPSAWANLQKYPSMLEEWSRISVDAQTAYFNLDGKPSAEPFEFEYNRPGVAQHAAYPLKVRTVLARPQLAQMLYHQCERLSIPISWDISIVAYEEDVASSVGIAVAADGHRFKADIVVAADGIGSKSHMVVLGEPIRAMSTGYTCYRMTIPTENIELIPSLRKVLEEQKRSQLRIYKGHNLHVVLVLSKTVTALAITREEEDAGSAVESWASTVPSERVLAGIPGVETWDTLITDTIQGAAENSIVRWKLAMRNPQTKWTSAAGHIIQVGDSAHSFVPTSANGACMALEDGASLAECLRRGGKKGAAIAAKVHELLRYQRVTLVQRTGFTNRRELHTATGELSKHALDLLRQGKWMWTHNSEAYAAENFDKARSHLESSTPFQNTNLPVGHQYEDWTLEEEVEKEKLGIVVPDLKLNGDWSVV
ncbi:hypothetical protein N7449_009668 [Penicillium cf. viridicatum]|uniref:FAD-binding domain-containing protein n=1 Tax=Penicillium cf. viridicatum TaxID=2972119 RepID=A0A9W9M895_9EURO|nr:hypothetical protein N7449_009668 [Penicillium cf. viridicatum]